MGNLQVANMQMYAITFPLTTNFRTPWRRHSSSLVIEVIELYWTWLGLVQAKGVLGLTVWGSGLDNIL